MTTVEIEAQEDIVLRGTRLLGLISNAWLSGKRHVWLEGGTEASKTYSCMQFLTLIGRHYPEPLHISVMSETMPHLKQGAMLDFKTIMAGDFVDGAWNKTDFIYTFPTGSWLQYFSADIPSKVKGPRRDVLFVNEVNHIDREIFRHADWRTRLFTLADWNPESEFWFHEDQCIKEDGEYILRDPEHDVLIRTTYLDALEVMTDEKRRELEDWADKDPNYWRVYGLGKLGKIEGLVYPVFKQVDELPQGNYFYGLDYGYSSDPTVLVKNVIIGDNLYSHQMFYIDTPMTNDDIAREMKFLRVSPDDPIYPDPSEPKSAEEIRQKGFNVKESEKGPGSVKHGIKRVNSYYQHWTKESLECIKEQRNYRYIRRREPNTGREYLSDDTTHQWSHGMDARRYPVATHIVSLRTKVRTKHDNFRL